MLAGIVIGATAVSGLYARGKGPGAYAIVDISEITDPAAFSSWTAIIYPVRACATLLKRSWGALAGGWRLETKV
jgi:hypothetical protein